ncbi:hypothetical protein GGX14DRAFT_578843 [Mycena pura]|uniref:F-box domain-containing protein n=1 Tax=Mycena pura TaxID=153505 RepID=A0AAD6XZ35_9AGAR|nr:hypothetical protein GGX14DRAFT_578843 [Mycena pura]
MPSHREFPNELWLQILSNVPKDNFPAVSLTNNTLCQLVRPLLYTLLDFHPYAHYEKTLLFPPSEEVDRSMKRLHFWRSDEIAPFVRSIEISPWAAESVPWSAWHAVDSPYILQDLLFAHLQSFTCLQRLSTRHINFTGTAISSLARMSALQHLSIEDCDVVAGGDLDLFRQTLALSSVTVKFGLYYMDVSADVLPRGYTLRPWLPLLHPDHLLELHLACDIRTWSENPSAVPDFPNVRRLFIHLSPIYEINRNFEILSKFRNVEVLTIPSQMGKYYAFHPQDSELPVLPALKELTCPWGYLPIARRAALTHLSITIFYTSGQLMTQLERLRNPTSITSLVLLGVQPLDDTALVTILTLCLGLVEIRLSFPKDTTGKAASLYKALLRTPSLPPTLKSLCFCEWEHEFDESHPGTLLGSEFQEIRAALVSRCPALTSLWLSGPGFAFHWRKYADQTIEESAEELQPRKTFTDFNEFWRTR